MRSSVDTASRPRFLALLLLVLSIPAFVAPAGISAVYAEDEEAAEDDTDALDRDPEISMEHFEDGQVAREEQRYGDAATSFWKALEADLLNYRAHVGYIQCAVAAGDDPSEITGDYDKFVEDLPKQFPLKLHRMRLDDTETRLPALEKMAKDKSLAKLSDLHLEIGRVHLAMGQPKPAVEALAKALALKSGDRPDVLLMLAEAEYAAGKVDEAMARLDGTVKADAEAFEARLVLARMQLARGEYENASANATTVVEQRPSYIAAFLLKAEALAGLDTPESMDEARQTLTSAYRANNEIDDVVLALADLTARDETDASYKQAIKYYDEVLERDEENFRALYGKAWVMERQEQWEQATDMYREVMAVRPSMVEAVNSVGFCLFKQGRVSESQVQFKRALDMNPEYVTAMLNLGATLDAQAKYGDAIKLYEKVLKMEGQEENLRALINCAFDYEAQGVFPKAQRMLKKAHEIVPDDANIVVWIGDNFYFQKKWDDAMKWYQQAIQMDEKSFFAFRGLGLSLAQKKKWSDAVAAFEEARKIEKEDLELIVLLGDIYYTHLKDLKTALERYQEFVQRGGNDPDVNDAIIEIKKELEKKRR